MIPSPMANGRRTLPGSPKQFRVLLTIFVIRHLLGLALFGWLLWQAVAVGGPFWIVMAVVTAGYAAFAFYNGLRLRGQYVRSVRAAAAARERVV